MQDRKLLALYDHDERLATEQPGARRMVAGRVVRHVDLDGGTGFVIHSDLDEATVDDAIEEQVAYFEGIGQDFEWKVFDHDRPADLRARLLARGFERDHDDTEALLILPLADAPARLLRPRTHDVHRVTDPADVVDLLQVQARVNDEDQSSMVARLVRDQASTPHLVSVFGAHVDDRPVSAGWIYYGERSRFAGLWGAATLPEHRKQGMYTALVAARAQEAIARGVEFLTIDARPMSRPIVEQLGFRFMTMTHPLLWRVGASARSR